MLEGSATAPISVGEKYDSAGEFSSLNTRAHKLCGLAPDAEFHKFLELCLPPSNSCPAAVVIVDARCGAAAPGSQLLLEAIALPRQPPSGAGGQRNIAARVVLAAQDLFRPLPGVLAAADICVVAWAGAASFYACHRTSLQRGPAAAAAQVGCCMCEATLSLLHELSLLCTELALRCGLVLRCTVCG